MLEVIIDTETTGLKVSEGHRIVEIGCIELENQLPTGQIFHSYINPEVSVSDEAYKVHGYSNEFLSKQKKFVEISVDFLKFIKGKKLIIHNAPFDLSFLNYELKKINKNLIDQSNVIDTLLLAREKFPGSQLSLDALCKKFKIDNSRRKKHNALIDCELLLQVYINLIDQKEPLFNFEKVDEEKIGKNIYNNLNKNYSKKIREISAEETKLHKEFLKQNIRKNFF